MNLSVLPSVSVCFPAYNEEETLADVLTDAHELLSVAGIDYEIIVCDDGSSDRTAAIATHCAREFPQFRVFHNPRNLGIRPTFEFLYAQATKDYVFLNSTDGQWKTSLVLEMLPMTSQWDIIIASRKHKHYGIARSMVSWAFNITARLLFRAQTYDAGAVKLVKREIIERFPLVSRSPFSEAERLIYATRHGYRVMEYPVEINPRTTGRARGVKPSMLWDACVDVFRVWRALGRMR